MGLAIVYTLFLLSIGWFFSQTFVFVPFNLFSNLESLSFYVFIALVILLVGWIVGD